jgi:hypothetical protein
MLKFNAFPKYILQFRCLKQALARFNFCSVQKSDAAFANSEPSRKNNLITKHAAQPFFELRVQTNDERFEKF